MTDEPQPPWYEWLLPLAFVLLVGGFVTSIFTAIYTGDWRWLIIAGICFVLFAKA